MPLTRITLILSAYTSMLGALVVVTVAAKPNDRTAYVIFPPWLSKGDAQMRIVASGARVEIGSWHFATRIALPQRETLARLHAMGAALVLSATPSTVCAGSRVVSP